MSEKFCNAVIAHIQRAAIPEELISTRAGTVIFGNEKQHGKTDLKRMSDTEKNLQGSKKSKQSKR